MIAPTDSNPLVFEQYSLECLSQVSYLVGDRGSGRAVVVDPRRDVAHYVADAAAHGLQITHVVETHFHADFVSGHLELAELTGASIVFGRAAEGRVEFPAEFLDDGAVIDLGDVSLEIAATPGHTPESICVVIRDGCQSSPWAVLTGDTLFVGDVGRPDLLGDPSVSAEHAARNLHHSLHERLLRLPDDTRVYPGHGAGSACGRSLSTSIESTIGEQRLTNRALRHPDITSFIHDVLGGQVSPPAYFVHAADLNRRQRTRFSDDKTLATLSLDETRAAVASGAVILDCRDPATFASGHLLGAINVGLEGRFAEYVGQVIDVRSPIVLVAEPGIEAETRARLARIGCDRLLGRVADLDGSLRGGPALIGVSDRLTPAQFAARATSPSILALDVREDAEVAGGTVPQALHVPLRNLVAQLSSFDRAVPVVVYCRSGYRSSIAASVLRSAGIADVSELLGGFDAWRAGGFPIALARRSGADRPAAPRD